MTAKVFKKNGWAKHKFQRIYALGQDRVRQIDALLYKGEPANEVARVIQEEWGKYTDVKHGTLTKQIVRYRNDVLKGTMPSNIQNPDGNSSGKEITQVTRIEGKIDALDTLEKLCLLQQQRLNKIYIQEQKLPSVMDTVRKEVETFARLIDQLANVQMDLGLLQRVPRKIQGELTLLPPEAMEQKNLIDGELASYEEEVKAAHRVFDLMKSLENGTALLVDENDESDPPE